MKYRIHLSQMVLSTCVVLGGCAANQLPGYQNTYKGYQVPETLVQKIRNELNANGLAAAQIKRDTVGRIQLFGNFRNEDEVDRAFLIIESIVGIKSTSPFYPENIQEKRWEIAAQRALNQFTKEKYNPSTPGVKRALIIGINEFKDKKISPILGADDAKLVRQKALNAGYQATTLLGSEATKANIETAIQQLQTDLQPNDSLLIYVSSHGTLPTPSPNVKDGRKMSIMAYDTVADSVLKAHDTAVPDVLLQELAKFPTRQTRVMIDTCYSGEILKNIPDESRNYILNTNGGLPERVGTSLADWTQNGYVAKGIFMNTEKESPSKSKTNTQEEINRLLKLDGKRYTVITATSDGQLSWGPSAGSYFESPVIPNKKLQGSFFTQAFFEYLDKHNGQLEPAFRDAKVFTSEKVRSIPAAQVPRMEPNLPQNADSNFYR